MRRKLLYLEYASEIPRELEVCDPKETLSAIDLHVKREMIDDDVHPGDSEFYPRMQRVYQKFQCAENAVEASKNTKCHANNLLTFNSVTQILENLEQSYSLHA